LTPICEEYGETKVFTFREADAGEEEESSEGDDDDADKMDDDDDEGMGD